MATNPWDIDGPLFPNFVKQAYKSGIHGAAAQGLSYAPTDKEMLVMDLLILAIIVTTGAAVAASAATAAGGGAAAAGGGAAATAGGAATGAAASGSLATGSAVASGSTALAATTGTAAATGTSTAAFSVVLPEVAVVGQAAATGLTIAQIAPLAVGVAGLGTFTPPPQTLPMSPASGGNTTYRSAESQAVEQAEADALNSDSLQGVLGNPLANLAGPTPSVLTPTSLLPTALPGFLSNLFQPSESRPPFDPTDGAKFRPEMRTQQHAHLRHHGTGTERE